MPTTISTRESIARKAIMRMASQVGARIVCGLTARANVRPILRRAALAAAGAGAAAALALGPSTPSSAAAIPIVNTNNQAGYLVGGNNWNFRLVQEVIKLPVTGCTGTNNHTNYLNSGVQLIGGGMHAGDNVAVGVACIIIPNTFSDTYVAGWAEGYTGNTFHLTHVMTSVAAGDQILVQLQYDVAGGIVQATAVDQTKNKTLFSQPVSVGRSKTYKQAVLSADVANPLPHPPPPGTSQSLVSFTGCAVTAYNGTQGLGIKPPPNTWALQQQQAVNGTHKIADASPLDASGKIFNVRIYG
jgi:hypothetical protein